MGTMRKATMVMRRLILESLSGTFLLLLLRTASVELTVLSADGPTTSLIPRTGLRDAMRDTRTTSNSVESAGELLILTLALTRALATNLGTSLTLTSGNLRMLSAVPFLTPTSRTTSSMATESAEDPTKLDFADMAVKRARPATTLGSLTTKTSGRVPLPCAVASQSVSELYNNKI